MKTCIFSVLPADCLDGVYKDHYLSEHHNLDVQVGDTVVLVPSSFWRRSSMSELLVATVISVSDHRYVGKRSAPESSEQMLRIDCVTDDFSFRYYENV